MLVVVVTPASEGRSLLQRRPAGHAVASNGSGDYHEDMSDNTMAASAAPATASAVPAASANGTTFAVILSLSFCHLLNDMMQSLVPALYPILKDSYALSFSQVGFITLAFQCTASMLQPVVGMYTDKHPQPYSLMVGMGFTLVGLLLMSQANTYPLILLAAALIGMGSSVFHPEASRVARMAAGGHIHAVEVTERGGEGGASSAPEKKPERRIDGMSSTRREQRPGMASLVCACSPCASRSAYPIDPEADG